MKTIIDKEGNVLFNVVDDNYISHSENEVVVDFIPDEETDIVAVVPYEITPLQFNIAMFQLHGITPKMILDKIDTFPEPQKTVAYIYYTTALVFKRDNEMLNQFAPSMELTQDNLDSVFIFGNTIE